MIRRFCYEVWGYDLTSDEQSCPPRCNSRVGWKQEFWGSQLFQLQSNPITLNYETLVYIYKLIYISLYIKLIYISLYIN